MGYFEGFVMSTVLRKLVWVGTEGGTRMAYLKGVRSP